MFESFKQLFGGSSKKQILAPVAGRTVPMSEVNDPTFSQEILGKGLAIIPSEGRVVAPADGEVVVMFETKHAVSIRTDDGTELIIHIGLDTVNLKGQYYTSHVAQGDRVKAGDLLVEFELDQIKEAGYDVITPIIICNTPDYPNMVCYTGKEVNALDPVIDL
ncbi:MAG: PTS glucose transporter subunit IIA [Hungatella sp.]